MAWVSKEWLGEFHAVQPIPKTRVSQPCVQWKPPPENLAKINFDGAIFSEANKSWIGVVVRNSQGLVLASYSQQLPQAYCPLEVEAMAAAKAFQFACKIGISNAVLERDSLLLISALRGGTKNLSPYGILLEDVWVCSTLFTQLCYSYVKREDNKIAHNLARFAVNIPGFFVWMNDVPLQFISVLQTDLAGFSQFK